MTPSRPRRRRTALVGGIALALIAGGIVAVALKGGDGGKGTPKPSEEPVPEISFTETSFKKYYEKRVPAPAAVEAEHVAVKKLLADYYRIAFVDPSAWGDPSFAAVQAMFTPEALPSFQRDLGSLTIGDGRMDFRRVTPTVIRLGLSIYFDTAGKPMYAVAAVGFRANATTADRRTVSVVQDAAYRMRRGADGWRIFSYDASQRQDTQVPSPSASGSPSP